MKLDIPTNPTARWEWIKYQIRTRGLTLAELARRLPGGLLRHFRAPALLQPWTRTPALDPRPSPESQPLGIGTPPVRIPPVSRFWEAYARVRLAPSPGSALDPLHPIPIPAAMDTIPG